MGRMDREHVMLIAVGVFLAAFLESAADPVVAVGALSAGMPPVRTPSGDKVHNHIVMLTQREVRTVTLTIPPSTVTKTTKIQTNPINLRTVTQTEWVTETEPTTVYVTQEEHSASLEACLRDMGSILTECIAENTGVRIADFTETEFLPTTIWMPTTITESQVTVTTAVTEPAVTVTTAVTAPAVTVTTAVTEPAVTVTTSVTEPAVTVTTSVTETFLVVKSLPEHLDRTTTTVTATAMPSEAIIDSAHDLINALSILVAKVYEIYPLVEEADKKVLDTLRPLTEPKTVAEQLRKLPAGQRSVIMYDMLKLTGSITGMMDESVRFKRVVPVSFMGSVKRLVRYLQRLIKF